MGELNPVDAASENLLSLKWNNHQSNFGAIVGALQGKVSTFVMFFLIWYRLSRDRLVEKKRFCYQETKTVVHRNFFVIVYRETKTVVHKKSICYWETKTVIHKKSFCYRETKTVIHNEKYLLTRYKDCYLQKSFCYQWQRLLFMIVSGFFFPLIHSSADLKFFTITMP